jgi:hypothetical protein
MFAGDRVMDKQSGRIGSSFEDFLKAEGTYNETTATAVKRVLAWQSVQAMAEPGRQAD